MGSDPLNGADECQQFQTDQGSLVDYPVFPFPDDYGVSRHLTCTSRQKGSVKLGAGQTPIDPDDGQTHTHGYNTRLKSKAENVMQGDDLQEKPSRAA